MKNHGKNHNISMKQLAKSIRERIKNNYDVTIIVDGPRGNGKSTFLYKLFTELGGFVPENDIVFSRDDLISKLKEKHGLIFQDEMINAGHNRDFYEKDQKMLVKMLNMYRDNYNILGGAVPFFYDLDNQLRKFIAVRVTILRRGFAVLQQAKASMYSNDPWESDVNKKIELSMQSAKKKNAMNYTKLTTFWGTLKFGALPKKQEARYHKIKADKRYQLIEAGDEVEVRKDDIIGMMAENKDKGIINTEDIHAYCRISGKKYEAVMMAITRHLNNRSIQQRRILPNPLVSPQVTG